MEEKTLGGAVNAFEEQFEKFKNSEQEPPVFLNTQREKSVSRIEKIQEKLYHQKIEREYRILLNPDLYYSEHSATALQLETDKKQILQAYNLFKGILEVNATQGDEETFALMPLINSPLAQREKYTVRQELGYLQAWLYFECNIQDYVPVMKKHKMQWYLTFVSRDDYYPTDKELEIIRVVEEIFYRKDTVKS